MKTIRTNYSFLLWICRINNQNEIAHVHFSTGSSMTSFRIVCGKYLQLSHFRLLPHPNNIEYPVLHTVLVYILPQFKTIKWYPGLLKETLQMHCKCSNYFCNLLEMLLTKQFCSCCSSWCLPHVVTSIPSQKGLVQSRAISGRVGERPLHKKISPKCRNAADGSTQTQMLSNPKTIITAYTIKKCCWYYCVQCVCVCALRVV